jgi:hypothetical protein
MTTSNNKTFTLEELAAKVQESMKYMAVECEYADIEECLDAWRGSIDRSGFTQDEVYKVWQQKYLPDLRRY